MTGKNRVVAGRIGVMAASCKLFSPALGDGRSRYAPLLRTHCFLAALAEICFQVGSPVVYSKAASAVFGRPVTFSHPRNSKSRDYSGILPCFQS